VIHGIRTFVPIMRRNGAAGLVVNTASRAGLMCSSSLYSTTKHTVVAISEALYGQLRLAGSNIEVAVLCPGAVNTDLARNSSRHRPSMPADQEPQGEEDIMGRYRHRVQSGMAAGQSPAEIAEGLIEGLRNGDFYIMPAGSESRFKARFDNILAHRVLDESQSYPQFQ